MLATANNCQLVVIDMQAKLLNAMDDAERKQVVSRSGILLKAASLLEIPVLVTEQYPKGLGKTDSALAESREDTAVYEKTCFSCLGQSAFGDMVGQSERSQYILCGIEAHVCVLQTALDLIAQGKEVFVVEDAVCSRATGNKQNALQRIRQAGGIISNMESVVFEWLRDARHARFKEISSLIR
jgi:nicotinamidase-related amidase